MKYHMQFASNKNPVTTIKTDRVTLLTPNIKNANLILNSVKASADDIYPWLPWATKDITIGDIENYINYFIKYHNSEKPSGLFFDIWDNKRNKYLGNVYFGQIEWRNPSFSIGYWLDSRECNKGYMVEAVNALSHVAFKHFKANRIEISTSKNNIRAKKIPEKLNFELESEFVNHHINYITKEVSNTLVYSCIDEKKLPKLPDLDWNTANQKNVNLSKKALDNDLNIKIIQWGREKLVSLGYTLKNTNPENVLNTPWSYLVRFETSDGYIYLKHTPELFALEPTIIQILHDQFHASVPAVVAHNAELHCFLMKDAGKPLREVLNKKFDEGLLCRAIDQFTLLQIAIADNVDVLLDIGVPDYRLNKLPGLYKILISQKELLVAEDLSEIEINKLESLFPKVASLCEKLSNYSIKQTIVQPDFSDNNTLIDDISKDITIIDLGEIVISHPFFSLLNCLQQIKKHHGLTDEDDTYLRIKDACFKNYIGLFESKDHFAAAFATAQLLHIVYGISYQYRFMVACGKEKLVSYQHWKLGGLLKKFMIVNIC